MKTLTRFILLLGLPVILMINSVGIVHADDPEPGDTDNQNPVVAFLSGLTGLDTQAILDFQSTGYGLGQIAKAYYLVDLSGGGELEAIMTSAKELGWGELYKSWGYHPSEIKGLGWLFKNGEKPDKLGPPDHANNDKEKIKDTSPPDHANDDKDKEDKVKDDKDDKDDKDKEDKDKD